jgi:mRNA interferase MazF
MITGNTARAGHPRRGTVRPGSDIEKGSGLLMDSVIMTDNLATIRYAEIDRVIGRLPDLTLLDEAFADDSLALV